MKKTQGKLKIFLGYAAGVGKTYAMLEAAHNLKQLQVDVVAGYIEPHQRKDTQDKTIGLEMIDPTIILYKGVELKEFDLKKALERHPKVILVDELAHTNIVGSRHTKRYQDVEELLRNGIDVYTTLNIQHIESLNDVVASITGVSVRERVPDSIFEIADSVELIDIPPKELIERFQEGKIYNKSQASRALANFFSEEKLIALRELSLRETANQINHQMYYEHNYYTKEHVLVCISPALSNEKVIRAAARLVEAFYAKFTAVYVENDDTMEENLKANIRLAEELGAQIITLYGDDVATQIAEYARVAYVSKIVIGKSERHKSLFASQSLMDQLTTVVTSADIYIIPDTSTSYYVNRKKVLAKETFRWQDGAIMVLILTIATLFGYIFKTQAYSESTTMLLYILAVLFISLFTRGRIWAILSSLLAVLIFNYLFTEPIFSLFADNPGYPFAFVFMFVVAFMISTLTTKIKLNDLKLANKTYRTEVLFESNIKFQSAKSVEDIILELGRQVKKLMNSDVVIYHMSQNKLLPTVFSDEIDYEYLIHSSEQGVANWVYENNKRAGAQTRTLSGSRCMYLAIRSTDKVVGVLAIDMKHKQLDPFEKSLLVSLINEAGIAIERCRLDDEQKQSIIRLQKERLRSNILRTISHDLRTPLTSIYGNASILLDSNLKEFDRRKLYEDIGLDAKWLIDLVENLLAMTKIDNETNLLKKEIEVIEDIVEESIRNVTSKSKRYIEFIKYDSVDLVEVDLKLMIQVFINILNNAIKYTPENTEIKVEILHENQYVIVSIADQGPGITNKKNLFDMFYTEEQDGNRGIGLGLYLVKEIITAHGGRIEVRDANPCGSIFDVYLERVELDENTYINH